MNGTVLATLYPKLCYPTDLLYSTLIYSTIINYTLNTLHYYTKLFYSGVQEAVEVVEEPETLRFSLIIFCAKYTKKVWKHLPAARVPTAFLVLPNFHLGFFNSIETWYMFSISSITVSGVLIV